jgi:alginate O-acetyltransferase complex protein AlgJ
MRRIALQVPLLIGAMAWAAATALLLVNLALPMLHHGPMKLSPPLTGVTYPEKPRGSWDSLLHGSYQASYARLIGTRMPLYADAVRLRNQVEYSLFGVSAIPALAVGPGPTLFELAYTEEYCARDIAAWRPGAEQWAAHIREMQDIEERRGRVFLYVLTPSKVAQYPGIIPVGYTCPARPADRTGMIPAWLAILKAAGVHVVDTTAVMKKAQGDYPFVMYPRGGSHWNDVGAALSQQAIMRELNRLDPAGGFAPFTFTWHMTPKPTGIDVDIANLMNLIKPFPHDPVPVVDVQPAPPPVPCPETKVTIVGGSFSHAMLEFLRRTTCNPSAVEYEYWHAYTLHWTPKGPELQIGADPAQRQADVLGADVLVYEENEQIMRAPLHGQALWQFLHDQPPPHPGAAG